MHSGKVLKLTEFLKASGFQQSSVVEGETPQEMMDYVCDNLHSLGLVSVNTDIEYRFFNIISFCSVIGSCLVFLTGIWNPKLSQHPYKLVSMIALIDATYFLLFNTLDEVCNFKLQTIYAYTAYFDGSAQS